MLSFSVDNVSMQFSMVLGCITTKSAIICCELCLKFILVKFSYVLLLHRLVVVVERLAQVEGCSRGTKATEIK